MVNLETPRLAQLDTMRDYLVELHQKRMRSVIHAYSELEGFHAEFPEPVTEVILIGEEHKLFSNQIANLARLIRPSVIVHEGFGPFTFDPTSGNLTREPDRKINEFEGIILDDIFSPADSNRFTPLFEVSRELGIPIVGADLTNIEQLDIAFKKIEAAGRNLADLVFRNPDPAELGLLKYSLEERENHMVNVANANKGTSLNPALVVLGFTHALDLFLKKRLANAGFVIMVSDATTAYSAFRMLHPEVTQQTVNELLE